MIHKEGRIPVVMTFMVLGALAVLVMLIFGINLPTLFFAAVLLVLFCLTAYFFRNPNRRVKQVQKGEILSVADGEVVEISEEEESEFMAGRCIRISVFMSIYSVHVNYFPISGAVVYNKYHPGKYLVAWHPKSSEKNEHTSVGIRTEDGTDIFVRQIAGFVARRIVCYAKEGGSVCAGQQLGFIKFGSRADVFLPLGSEVLVKEGDKVRACQSVIAKLRQLPEVS